MTVSPKFHSLVARPWLTRPSSWLALICGGVAAGGCTFVNTFADVEQHPPDTGVAQTDSGNPQGDTGLDSGDTAPPDQGIVVVGGHTTSGTTQTEVLEALDPATGASLTARETLQVNAVVYDAIADVWYVFENTTNTGTIPAPSDQIKLHARKFDLGKKAWNELGTLLVPVFFTPETIIPLKSSLAYVGYKDSTGTSFQLNVINTADPSQMKVIDSGATDLDTTTTPIGMMGAAGTGAATGGTLLIARRDASSTVTLLPVTVPNQFQTPIFLAAKPSIGTAPDPTKGAIDFGSKLQSPASLVGIPQIDPGGANATATIQQFNPTTGDPTGSGNIPLSLNSKTALLRPLGFSECKQILFVSELLSETVYAIPVNAPTKVASVTVGHPARGAYYEPYTDQVFEPFTQAESYSLTALNVTVQADGTPTLNTNTDFSPPQDLQPDFVATRSPVNFKCK